MVSGRDAGPDRDDGRVPDPGASDHDEEPVPDPVVAIEAARTLSDLVGVTGADTEHDAYFRAKQVWYDYQQRRLASDPVTEGLPGSHVRIDGHDFHVHGITHADTEAERSFLREHVSTFRDRGATVYCEQGIRPMYFGDMDGVCEIDDYRWAMQRCRDLDLDSHVEAGLEFEGVVEEVDSLTDTFRDAVFSLVESGGDVYGEAFERALGDLASSLLTSHEGLATGEEFESFAKTRRAASDPTRLVALQNYYRKRFLPQPIEREWLRRHDRQLEIVTHARNERMADYVWYHNDEATEVHLIVGAAHQPGVTYYLEQFRDGERSLDGFEAVV